MKRWHLDGKNQTLDTGMTEIRESLEELIQAMREEQPCRFGVEDTGLDIVDEDDERVADATTMLADLDSDEDTRLCKTQIESL